MVQAEKESLNGGEEVQEGRRHSAAKMTSWSWKNSLTLISSRKLIFFGVLRAEDGLNLGMDEGPAAWIAEENYCWHFCYSSTGTVKVVWAKLPLVFRSHN
jgi:hypothetical protein